MAKKINNTATKELKQLTESDALQIADIVASEYAQTTQGATLNARTFDEMSRAFTNESAVSKNSAKTLFTPFIGTLLEKVLMSTLAELPDLEYMSFVDFFRGKDIKEGAAIEHQAQQIGGYLPYSRGDFYPQKAEYKNVLSQNVSLSSADFKQIKIPLTINVNEIQYYMTSPTALTEFLNRQREALSKTHTLIMFNMLMEKITTQTYAKTVNGTATNMFDAIIEVTNIITEMSQLSQDFNITNQTAPANNYLTNSKFEDLMWIWTLKNDNIATMGIKSQLFNRNLWGDPVTEKLNMVALKNRYDVSSSDASAVPTKNAIDWVNDNTIYIINKDAFKINYQIDNLITSQNYSENMLLQININCWFLISAIKFGQGFKYINTNLSVIPN